MSTISVICPIYNGEKYIEALNKSLMLQKQVNVIEIKYILTRCKDKSEDILKSLKADYKVIEPKEFSHSLVRENAAYSAKGDILVFITQDIIIEDELWMWNLIKDIEKGICDAAYSRQICDNTTIERYTRRKNYSDESRVVSKDDINKLGIMTYFFSDASSAIRKETFISLNGYDGKDLLTNEDMYIAYKLINNGFKIKYCSDSKVIHSHIYTYKSLFKRYFDQGVFLKDHEYIYKSGASGGAIGLLKYVILNSIKEGNIKVLVDIIPNFAVRFVANKFGRKYQTLKLEKILKFTGNKNYWLK